MNIRPLAIAAALLLASGAQAQNLIVNGDFEASNAPLGGWEYVHNTGWGNPGVVAPGWSMAGNTGTGIINHDASGWAWQGMASASAVAFLQDHPVFNGAAPLLSQQFSSNGTAYTVSFELGQRGSNQQDVIVSLDGVALAAPIVAAANGMANHYSFNVAGLTGSTHVLSFTSAFTPGDQTSFIDNVSVVATAFAAPVPEPASFGLMGLGLLGMGLLRQRRRA